MEKFYESAICRPAPTPLAELITRDKPINKHKASYLRQRLLSRAVHGSYQWNMIRLLSDRDLIELDEENHQRDLTKFRNKKNS